MKESLLDRAERKLRKIAIKNLMLIMVGGMALVFFADLILFAANGRTVSQFICFDAGAILRGEVWRVLSFVFLPPESSAIFIVFALYFYWLMGSALEREWGAAKFNLFYFCGVLSAIVAGFISYLIPGIGRGIIGNHYLNMSMFFAFAILYPDFQIMLFFILPIKIKWLAIFDAAYFAAMLIISIIKNDWSTALTIVLSLANVAIFFGGGLVELIKRKKRQAEWRRNFR